MSADFLSESLIADIAVAAVLLIFVRFKAKQGFYKCISPLIAFIIAAVGAWFITGLLTEPITNVIAPRVIEKIGDSVSTITFTGTDASQLSKIDLPSFIKFSETNGGVFSRLASYFGQAYALTVEAAVRMAVRFILFIVCFIVLRIVCRLILRTFRFIGKLPFVKWFDKLGGAVIGLGKGIIIVWLVCIALDVFGIADLSKMAEESHLLKFFV